MYKDCGHSMQARIYLNVTALTDNVAMAACIALRAGAKALRGYSNIAQPAKPGH